MWVIVIIIVRMCVIPIGMIVIISMSVIRISVMGMSGLFVRMIVVVRMRIGISAGPQVEQGKEENKEITFHFPEI